MDLSVGFAVVYGEKVFSPDADKPQGEAVIAADGLRDWLGLGYEQLEEAMVLLGQSTVLPDVSESVTVVDAAHRFLETLLPNRENLDFAVFPGCYYAVGDEVNVFVGAGVTLARLSAFFGGKPFKLYLRISSNAGEVMAGAIPGVSFRINSRESGRHHEAHVHVSYEHRRDFAVSLIDGHVLAGEPEYEKVPRRVRRAIDQRIRENSEELLRFWNDRTDGIKVDVNVILGQTDCTGLR